MKAQMTKRNFAQPVSVFLSYKREDTEEVRALQQHLYAHGIGAWRDVTDLSIGGHTEQEIIRIIKEECDAFVLYATPASLYMSEFIWETEVPAAAQRQREDKTYKIAIIFRGVTTNELQQFCFNHSYPSLTDFNGFPILLPEQITGENKVEVTRRLRDAAQGMLKSTLQLRLSQVEDSMSYQPTLCLRTWNYTPPSPTLDLDVNWSDFFEGSRIPSQEEWQEILLPGLQNMKDVLSGCIRSRKLHIYFKTRLPAAFVLGRTFSAPTGFTLMFKGDNGETWSTAETVKDLEPLEVHTVSDQGDSETLLVEVAISRETSRGVTKSISGLGLSYRHRIRFAPPEIHRESVRDAQHAFDIAHQIGLEVRRLKDNKSIKHIHLFLACPVELAALIGHQFNAMGKVTLYHYLDDEGLYLPVCTLDGTSKRAPTS
jgi:hypothetical protein